MDRSKKWRSKREIPLDVIERWLKDPDWRVRQAAANACSGREIPRRTFDPPALVYKKCEAGVIVVAKIPEDAEVRGNPGGKCRSNKAEIVEIIGSFCGEPVGISKYDGTTWYYAGDMVEVEDFDYSDDECSTGFHFFCTKEQAENY